MVAAAGERIAMPSEDWMQHCKVAQFLYDLADPNREPLRGGRGGGTIWATTESANREIAASQAQTAVAQKQIETTLRLERRRAARESFAFHAMLALSRQLGSARREVWKAR
jgi:hypothetical protein